MIWNNFELPNNPYYQDDAVVIYHGDCREILPKIPDKSIDLVLTDPPYVGLQGGDQQWGYNGVGKNYRKYKRVADPWHANFEWLRPTWDKAKLGMMVFCSYHNAPEIANLMNGVEMQSKRLALISWYKRNAPPAIRNVPHHRVEYIWAFQRASQSGLEWGNLDTHYDIPNLATGCMASERSVDKEGSAIHPTQKPEALISELLKVKPQTILDPFLGTGTTAYCAKKLGCHCIGIEINEKYCELAVNRLRQSVMILN